MSSKLVIQVFLATAGVWAGGVSAAVDTTDKEYNPVPAIGQNAEDVKFFDENAAGPRVLFVGNSITLHGPRPQIGWNGNWGMAASKRDLDYVHRVQRGFALEHPDAQFCLLQVAGTIERSFFKPDWSVERNFKWARQFKPDYIVMFFGANVPGEYDSGKMESAPARSFGAALEEFIRYVDPGLKSKVLLSEGFYTRPKLEKEKREVAAKLPNVTIVGMEDIRNEPAARGRYNHPGDYGMELIANRFLEYLKKLSAKQN